MGRIKTFVAGGSLLASDINSIQDEYERLHSTWIPLLSVSRQIYSSDGANRVLANRGTNSVPSTEFGQCAVYLAPSEWTAGNAVAREKRVYLTAMAAPGDTAPAQSISVGLYRVTSYSGATIGSPLTLGQLVGSEITFTGLTADTPAFQSGYVVPTVDDYYCIGVRANAAVSGGVDVVATIGTRFI